MTPQEYAKLLLYIYQNNSWGPNMYDLHHNRHRRTIKYVTAVFDSRDGSVYSIKFSQMVPTHDRSSDIFFRIENKKDIQRIYDFLNEEC